MLKESFIVEGEGCEAATEEEEGNLVERFVNHVKVRYRYQHGTLTMK